MFKKLWEKWTCMHQWEKQFTNTRDKEYYSGLKIRQITVTYICKKCGKFKQIQTGGDQ